ncbi:hypothetical protein [Candidatus Protochlamydia sp. R18]|uniref:hypothetical protein n=1 Tax=Candidatus Protochlamydia sp. R18 TaxID=1353977 RepID=UPI0005A72CF4|nr:hypothetical protein [Candidatus Protochlamydia sp. R18]
MGPGNPSILHITVPAWAAAGYIYGKVANVSPKMCALIFAVSKIADVSLSICHAFFSYKTGFCARISVYRAYAVTSLIVNTITIIAMYRLKLIAQTGAAIFAGLSVLYFIGNYNFR